ncbi:unnamed protein product [Ascophyllum nodosum]
MVILSAAITTRNGKALLARQFVDMSRIRIEGLLAAFPKLMGTGNKQHTFIETDTVRYVYQPIENLFLLLVTNKASNIVQDLETLRMLSKVVPDVAVGVSEEKVTSKAFELVFAFDEVITTGGHKENINLQQASKTTQTMQTIRTNMEMDSHEERLHNMIQDSKREAAKEEAGRRAKELREKQKEAALRGGSSGMTGIGGGSMSMSSSSPYPDMSDYASSSSMAFGEGSGLGASGISGVFTSSASSLAPSASAADPRLSKQGMKLGGPSKGRSMLESLMKEDQLVSIPSAKPSAAGSNAAVPAATVVAASVHPVTLSVEERLSCQQLSREATLESMEVKGTLSLTANSDGANKCKVVLASTDPTGAFAFQTHPKVNKGLYDSAKTLASKDLAKGFPVARPVGVLRWSLSTTDDAHMPLTINCWPEPEGGGQMNVSMEYELVKSMELHDVRITIPLGSSAVPEIAAADGSYRHNSQEGTLVWSMDLLDQSNKTGSLEFNIASRDTEAFFPITVTFASKQLFCDVQVAGVVNAENNSPIQYGYTASLTTESYTVS